MPLEAIIPLTFCSEMYQHSGRANVLCRGDSGAKVCKLLKSGVDKDSEFTIGANVFMLGYVVTYLKTFV